MASDATNQQHFLHYLPIFHFSEQPPISTTTVVSPAPTEATTTTTGRAPQAEPEHASGATTSTQHHGYVSLQHLSELLHNLSLPHVQVPHPHVTLPHVQLPHPNLTVPHLFSPSAHPAFDVVETKAAFVVTADLAGLGPEDVVVEANDYYCTLTVSGTIPQPDPLAALAGMEKAHGVDKHQDHHHHHHKGHGEPHEVGIGHKENAAEATTAPGATEREAPAVAAPESAAEGSTKGGENVAAAAEGSKGAENVAAAEDNKSSAPTAAKPPAIYRHVTERRPGPFHRQFQLPSLGEVDMAGCRASMHHGLLTVVVPKNPERPAQTEEELARARRLRIVSASFAALAPGMPIF